MFTIESQMKSLHFSAFWVGSYQPMEYKKVFNLIYGLKNSLRYNEIKIAVVFPNSS